MIKRQSSIKGRGGVLVGTPQAVPIKPEGTGPFSTEREPPEQEPPEPAPTAGPGEADVLGAQPEAAQSRGRVTGAGDATATGPSGAAPEVDPRLSAALYAEARDGEPLSDTREEPAALASAWPPAPEMEWTLFGSKAGEVQAAQPATRASILTLEENMSDLDEAQASSYETSQAASGLADDQDLTDAFDIQSPYEPVERYELPERSLTEQQRRELAEATAVRIQKLDREIDQIYVQVRDEVGENDSIATECFNNLLKARDIIQRRDLARLAQAEYYVEQARARLKRASASAAGARRNAWWILAWGFLWGMVFVALLVLLDSQWVKVLFDYLDIRSTFVDPEILLPAMVWGGIGGVVAIWYSLFKHVAQRDFDRAYKITYVGKPFFGLVLGATVYMVINLLVVSLGVGSSGAVQQEQIRTAPTIAPWIVYLLAWISGFKENRVFGMVDQAVKRIFSGGQASTT